MKTVYVNELQIGEIVGGETFAILEKKKAQDRNGMDYYNLLLGDKTGQIAAKVWPKQSGGIDKSLLKVGKIVAVTGVVDEFKGSMQFNIEQLGDVDEVKLEEYLESSAFPVDEMWQKLMNYVSSVKQVAIRKTIDSLLADPEMEKALKYYPAGVYVHHGFRSGMLQHILEILDIASSLKPYYPEIDFDYIVAGAIFHDIGKVYELKISGAAIEFGLEGVMVGHLVMSYEILLKHMPEGINERTKLKLKHMILAHHGKRDRGTPAEPVTIEAMLLAAADHIVFQVGAYHRIRKQAGDSNEDLSGYDNIMGTRVYVGE